VTAEVIDGDLLVAGEAAAAVEIVANGPNSVDVYEGDQLIASLGDVRDDIYISLQSEPGSEAAELQDVTLRLDGASVDQISARLGDQPNRLVLASGETRGSVRVLGGNDADIIEVEEDFTIGRGLLAYLRDGDNSLELHGVVERNLSVQAGDGDDFVFLGATADVAQATSLRLGGGDNALSVEGSLGGSLNYRGGDGHDFVELLASAAVEGRSSIWLGGADNTLSVEGTLGSHLNAFAGSGDDEVMVDALANIAGIARLRLGSGQDSAVVAQESASRWLIDASTDVTMLAAPPVASAAQLRALFGSQLTFQGIATLT